MKKVERFEAFDGEVFDTEAKCRAHEKDRAHIRLIGLNADDIERAIKGDQDDLADALEQVGAKIARERRARGELKRERRAPGQEQAAGSQDGHQDSEAA